MADPDPGRMLQANLDLTAVNLLLHSVRFTLERWPGGHPDEQESLVRVRDVLFRMQLELQVDSMN